MGGHDAAGGGTPSLPRGGAGPPSLPPFIPPSLAPSFPPSFPRCRRRSGTESEGGAGRPRSGPAGGSGGCGGCGGSGAAPSRRRSGASHQVGGCGGRAGEAGRARPGDAPAAAETKPRPEGPEAAAGVGGRGRAGDALRAENSISFRRGSPAALAAGLCGCFGGAGDRRCHFSIPLRGAAPWPPGPGRQPAPAAPQPRQVPGVPAGLAAARAWGCDGVVAVPATSGVPQPRGARGRGGEGSEQGDPEQGAAESQSVGLGKAGA